jgi:hypothetical protein
MTGDYRAELAVGRFSVENVDQCNTLVAKTLGYERTPFMQEPGWFKKATLIVKEDPSGNDPYWFTINYAYDQLVAHGYTTVDRFCQNWGHDRDDVILAINEGRAFVAYRGITYPTCWKEPFDFLPDELNNGWKLPVVITGSCYTGAFGSPIAMCNTWTRAGDSENPKGAVAYLGTSTVGLGLSLSWSRGYTSKGFFKAIFEENIYTLGDIFVWAKNFMADSANEPPQPYPDLVEQEYNGWNLIGDPTLQLWTDIPKSMTVQHPGVIEMDVPIDLVITVYDTESQLPIQGALVTLYKPDGSGPEIYESIITDNEGMVVFENLTVPTSGTMYATVTFQNCVPYQGEIQVYQMMTDDPLALAYNGNRHLVRKPNSEELYLVYTNEDEIIYRYSSNGGTDWSLPEIIGEGEYPAISLSRECLPSVTWTDNEGGLWYRRQFRPKQWGNIYHLYNPGFQDPYLNSPPSMVIIPSAPDIAHILVTRSGGIPGNGVAHTVEDFSFPIIQPEQGIFRLIEQTYGPLEPPLRSNPSITICDVDNSLHGVWMHTDTVWYGTKQEGIVDWNVWGWQFFEYGLQSAHPFVETYGDSVFVVWQHLEPPTLKEEVYRAANWIYYSPPQFTWSNLSLTPMTKSLYSVNASGFFTVFVDELEPPIDSRYEIFYKIESDDPLTNISQTEPKSIYPQSVARFHVGRKHLYTAWLEGDEIPYEIRFKKIRYVEPDKPDRTFLSSSNGHNPSSPYLIARDSFIADWQIPVDIGYETITYQFPLEPGYYYKLKTVAYHECEDKWKTKVMIDNEEVAEIEYEAYEPETLACWIPSEFYADSVVEVIFECDDGDFTSVGLIYIYQYEYEEGEGGFPGGPMTQENHSLVQFSFICHPNPFNDKVHINFSFPTVCQVKATIYDVAGRFIKKLYQDLAEGSISINWCGSDDDGNAVSQGVYFLQIENLSTGETSVQKILKIK